MAGILINELSKSFNNVVALKNVSVHIGHGEFLVLLGPSGCGKTTTLRCVSGLEEPTMGEIYFGEQCVFSRDRGVNVPPKDRHIGFVFQSYALYPHMNVYHNVAFGLSTRGVRKHVVRQRVNETLRLVDLEGFEDRYPRQLSGGQQQRVAVARVIAAQPETLLFDEPLSNLDPKLRVSLRAHLKELHKRLGTTSIYVTHDQSEAMILADRIAVMWKGEIVQVGSAGRIYHFPETVSVAEITGDLKTNLIWGEVYRTGDRMLLIPKSDPYCFIRLDEECRVLAGQQVVLHVRPEDVQIVTPPAEDEGRLKILAVISRGIDALVHLRIGEHQEQIVARGREAELLELKNGQDVSLRLRRGNIYNAETERIMRSFGYSMSGDTISSSTNPSPLGLP